MQFPFHALTRKRGEGLCIVSLKRKKKIGEGAVNHITPVKKSYCIVQLDMITVSALFGATR